MYGKLIPQATQVVADEPGIDLDELVRPSRGSYFHSISENP